MDTTQKNRPAREGERPAQQRRTRPDGQRPQSRRQAATEQPRQRTRKSAQPEPAARSLAQPRRTAPVSGGKAPHRANAPARKRATPRTREEIPEKKRAYGNSKPRKPTRLQQAAQLFSSYRQKAANDPKAKARKAAQQKKRQQFKKQMEAPAVIYTQPKPFNRDRLILQMTTVAAVVLAVVLGLSVFFKVETITVSGAEVYSAWAVREASGITEGDNLLTFSKIRAAGQIMAKLPYVEKVRIGIKLPDTVNIMVKEASVVYALKASDGTWWLMDSEGRIIEQTNNAVAASTTQVLGITLESPEPNGRAIATEMLLAETAPEGEEVPMTTTGALRLSAALKILNALEANDIVGEVASVDVSNIEEIILWYGTRYQVNLGDSTQLETKINWMNDAILQLSDYQIGVLDISFTIWPDRVVYTPFE